MIGTSLLDAVEHDLNVGSCEFFEFQLPEDGNDVLLDNASDVARIAVTFSTISVSQRLANVLTVVGSFCLSFSSCFFCAGLMPWATIERHFSRQSRASASEKAGYSPSVIFCDLLSKR